MDGVTIGCITMMIVSRFSMEVGWDTLEVENNSAYEPESAQQLGMNILG